MRSSNKCTRTYQQAKHDHLADVEHDISLKCVQWQNETTLDPLGLCSKHCNHPDNFPSSKRWKSTFRGNIKSNNQFILNDLVFNRFPAKTVTTRSRVWNTHIACRLPRIRPQWKTAYVATLPLAVYQDLELHHNFHHVLSYPNNLQNINYRIGKDMYFKNL